MSHSPVPGVDYLVDHYQILGIERSATSNELTSTWRAKVKQYHPDRMGGLAPELIANAEHKLSLINEAYGILSDTEKRVAFDSVLENWTKPISIDGRAIIDLTGSAGFSFAGLLGHMNSTDEEQEDQAEQIAKDLSGFNTATYDFFTTQAASEAGIPKELLPAYMEQLRSRDMYLQLKESFIWENLGLQNFEPKAVLGYAAAASDELERIRGEAQESLAREVKLLTSGGRTLLPAPKASGALVTTELFEHHHERLVAHFAKQEERLLVVAKEREVVLRQIFESGSEITYHPDVVAYTDLLVVEIVFPSQTIRIAFKLEDGHAAGLEVEGLDTLSDPDTAREWIRGGYTIVSFKPQEGIDTKDELGEVISRHAALLSPQDTN